jgi:hypothetical protein
MSFIFALLAFLGAAVNQQEAAGKVSMQDFHFTQTAGKVSMQDFHFVQR